MQLLTSASRSMFLQKNILLQKILIYFIVKKYETYNLKTQNKSLGSATQEFGGKGE